MLDNDNVPVFHNVIEMPVFSNYSIMIQCFGIFQFVINDTNFLCFQFVIK